MFDIIAVFRLVLELLLDLGRTSSRRLAQPLLTAICLTAVYTAVHVSQERSIAAGLKSAFFDTATDRQHRRRIEDSATLQAELHQFVAANKLINQILENIMLHAPGASRVSLSVIHNGVTGMTGTGLLRYDDTNSVAAQGRLAIPVKANQPLADWSEFLPGLLGGQCVFRHTKELQGASLRARIERYGVASLLVCPAADVQGKVVGAVFVMWDTNDPLPSPAQLQALRQAGQHQGAQIAAVLDLRGPSPIIPTLLGN